MAVAVGAAVVLSACARDGTSDRTEAGGPTSTLATTPSTEASGGSPTTAPAGDEEPRFDGDMNPDVSSDVQGNPVLVSVTQGEHEGYRRYVFTFRSVDPEGHQPGATGARPRWDVRYVPQAEAVQDGSGEPVVNSGANAHLKILFGAAMHDAEGRSTLERSVSAEPPDLVFAGDFEGQVTWFYGASAARPFRVFYVGDGRVAVDIAR